MKFIYSSKLFIKILGAKFLWDFLVIDEVNWDFTVIAEIWSEFRVINDVCRDFKVMAGMYVLHI